MLHNKPSDQNNNDIKHANPAYGHVERIGNIVHESLDLAERTMHFMGEEVRGLGLAANLAEIGHAIIHDPSEDIVEKAACGTVTGLAKAGLNTALTAGLTAGVGTTATPGIGIAAGILAQKSINQLTERFGELVSDQCHGFVAWLREPKQLQQHENLDDLLKKENPTLLEYFEQEKRRALRYQQEAVMNQYDEQPTKQHSFLKNIYETLSSYVNIMPSAKAALAENNQGTDMREIALKMLFNEQNTLASLTYPKYHALTWLNQHADEIKQGQFSKDKVDAHIKQTIENEELTQEQAIIYAYHFAKTISQHLHIDHDKIMVNTNKVDKTLRHTKLNKKTVQSELAGAQKNIASEVIQLEKDIQKSFYQQTKLTKQAIQNAVLKKDLQMQETLKNWVDGSNMMGQGLMVAGHLANNKPLMKLGTAAMGVSSIMKGFTPIAALGVGKGLTFGSASLILGGINTILGCFDQSDDNQLGEALNAIMQQLQFISKQIDDLHQDMREQFDKVFKALGKIHYDMLKHFMELHKETKDIQHKLVEMRECLHEIRGGITDTRKDIRDANIQHHAYHYTQLDTEWVKAVQHCQQLLKFGSIKANELKEQHSNLIASLNVSKELKTKSLRVTNNNMGTVVSKSLDQTFLNAIENFNLLFFYYQTNENKQVNNPIHHLHEPHALIETIDQLIDLFNSYQQSNEYKAMPEPIFNDYQALLKESNDVLTFFNDIRQPDYIKKLFSAYKNNIINVMTLINQIKLAKEKELNDKTAKEMNGQLNKQYDDFVHQHIDQIDINVIGDWYTKGGYGLRRPGYYRGDEWQGASTAKIYATDHETNYITQRKKDIFDQFTWVKNNLSKKMDKDNIHISFDRGVSIKGAHRLFSIIRPIPNQLFNIILPLRDVMTVPQEYYEAHALGLGQLSYYYEVNNNQTVLNISSFFQYKDNAILIKTWDLSLENSNKKLDNLPVYNKLLSPNEALWNYWVGGHFAATNQSIDCVTHSGHDACAEGGGYHQYFCQQPVLTQHNGYYHYSSPSSFTAHTYNEQCKIELKKEMGNLNQTLNDYLFEQSTSSRPNHLTIALRKMDISAKLLYGYLVLAFNNAISEDNFLEQMPCLFNKDKIDDFLKSPDSLSDQLQINIALLDKIEEYLINHLENTMIENNDHLLMTQLHALNWLLHQLLFEHKNKTMAWEEAENHLSINPQSYADGLEVGKTLAMSTIVMALNAAQLNTAANIINEKINDESIMPVDQEISRELKEGFFQALTLEVHEAASILLQTEQIEAASWLLKFSHDELWKMVKQHSLENLMLMPVVNDTSEEMSIEAAEEVEEAPAKKRKLDKVSSISLFKTKKIDQSQEIEKLNFKRKNFR